MAPAKSLVLPLLLSLSSVHAQTFWIHTAFHGQTGSICIDQNDRIFAGEINQGVHRSTDGGTSWIPINNGLTQTNINSMAASLTGDIFAGASAGAVFRSTDSGESWHWISDTTAGYVDCIAIDSAGTIFYGTEGYVGSPANLFRSTDNGNNWEILDLGVVARSIRKIVVKSTGNLFASVDTFGVFHSTDNGNTWTQSLGGVTVTALLANTNGHLFAGTFGSMVLKSTDDGASWTPVSAGFPGQWVANLSHNSVGYVYVSVRNVTFGWGLVYQSTDNGMSWVDVTSGTDSAALSSIAFNSNGVAYAASDFSPPAGGVLRSVGSTTDVDIISSTMPSSFALFQNYPNPFNPGTKIRYQLSKTARVALKVYDVLGNEVGVLAEGVKESGVHEAAFDAGHLPSGVYIYTLTAGEFRSVRKLIVLK